MMVMLLDNASFFSAEKCEGSMLISIAAINPYCATVSHHAQVSKML